MKPSRLLLLVVLSGCAHVSVQYSVLNSPPRPMQPKTADAVELFTTNAPDRKYVELGTLSAMHDSVASDEDMFKQIRADAATRGCDGVVVTQRGGNTAVAACIVYTSP